MSFKVKTTLSGARNHSVQISGFLKEDHEDKAFELARFANPGLRLVAVQFLIQEKAGLYLWWDEDRIYLISPLESRGSFKFDIGLKMDGWLGAIWAQAFGVTTPKGFLITMDFDK